MKFSLDPNYSLDPNERCGRGGSRLAVGVVWGEVVAVFLKWEAELGNWDVG